MSEQQLNECPICMDNIEDMCNKVITECGHIFHCSCLMKNVNHNGFKCPCCRSKMADESDGDSNDESDGDSDEERIEFGDLAAVEPSQLGKLGLGGLLFECSSKTLAAPTHRDGDSCFTSAPLLACSCIVRWGCRVLSVRNSWRRPWRAAASPLPLLCPS